MTQTEIATVIPDSVIQNWNKCYEENSELRTTYPDLDWDKIINSFTADKVSLGQYLFAEALPQKKPEYIATAGAPGSGKSTLLDLQTTGINGVFIDPDRYTMTAMTAYRLYLLSAGMIAKHGNEAANRLAYNVCRGASNAMSLQWLNECVSRSLNIKHGTTLSGKPSRSFLQGLKNNGYRTRVLVCLASKETILSCLEHRRENQAYYQSTPEDELAKIGLFYDRLPMYFEEADIVEVYYKPSLVEQHVKVGHHTQKTSDLIDSESAGCEAASALIGQYHNGLTLMDLMLGMGMER